MVFLKEQNLLIEYCLNDTQTYINEYNNRGFGGLEGTELLTVCTFGESDGLKNN